MCPLAKSDWLQRTIPVWPLQPPDAAGHDTHTLDIITLTWSWREIIGTNEKEGGEVCWTGAALCTRSVRSEDMDAELRGRRSGSS